MIRRSKRLEEAPLKPSVEGDSDNDDTMAPMAEREAPKKKKRKLVESRAADAKSLSRKGKGKRGLLKDVVDMPMDVLFEIFEYLEPLDLLNLSRTSKNLRALLMSRSSISIWKRVFKNVATPRLPECPQDLNEPQYAELAFSKSCTFCGRKLAIIHIAWHMRVKTCNTCLKDHFSEHVYSYSISEIYDVIPTIAINQNGRSRYSKRYALRNAVDDLLEEYQKLNHKAKAAWLKKKSEERDAIRAHANAYSTWAEKHQAGLKAQKANVIAGRKAIVVDYLRELGWGEELDMIPTGIAGPEDDQTIVKFCQKEVTPHGLQGMEQYFNEYMEGVKSRRMTQEQKVNLQAKLVTLKEIYTTYLNTLPPDVLYPKTTDVFQEPRVKEIMYDPASLVLSPEQLDKLHDIFPDVLRSWPDSIKQRVIESISKDGSSAFNPTNVLELASTALQCDRCSMTFPAKEVIRHKCGSQYQYDLYGTEQYELFKHISDYPWCGRWRFSKDTTEKVAKVLKMCSFDPATTTTALLEKADPIFECLGCHEVVRGRCMLSWFGLHQHCKSHVGALKMIVVDKEAAPKIQERMNEERERDQARYRSFICTHCRSADNFVKILAHVKSNHQVSKPIPGEDVIISPDASSYHGAFYSWPPRIQEDVEEMMKEIQ